MLPAISTLTSTGTNMKIVLTMRYCGYSLQWLLNLKNSQMATWLRKLQQYDFTIQYCRGRLNGKANALAGRHCEETARKYCERREIRDAALNVTNHTTIGHKENIVFNLVCETVTNHKEESRAAEAQNQDPKISIILQWMHESKNKPSWQEVASNMQCSS